MQTTGIVIVNLGTPDDPSTKSVRRYLREFLSDPRVIDLPFIIRQLLLNMVILPFRPKSSAKAYQAIWQPDGSPLMIHSQALVKQLDKKVNDHTKVVLAMRYGNPSISDALSQVKDVSSLIIVPMYPQYASASTGSSIEACLKVIKSWPVIPSIKIIRDFYDAPEFILPTCELIKKQIEPDDFLLLSYHGLPERQLIPTGCNQPCAGTCKATGPQGCYRRQCYRTSAAIATHLGLTEHQYTTAFQSRLGKTPWIQPYTDELLEDLLKKGHKKLVVACPSFVADCLETLEEIGLQLKSQWLSMGGETFKLIPCVNAEENWVTALQKLIDQ